MPTLIFRAAPVKVVMGFQKTKKPQGKYFKVKVVNLTTIKDILISRIHFKILIQVKGES